MNTLTYVARRLILAVVTLFGITLVTFSLMALAPGDPAKLALGEQAQNPEQTARRYKLIRERFHLDEPIPVRYALWLEDLATGNLGDSLADFRPVGAKIRDATGPTVAVNLTGDLLAVLVALPLGLLAAARQDRVFDRVSGAALYALYSIPSYVGAIVLILFVGVRWNMLPFRGLRSDDHALLSRAGQLGDYLAHMTLYVVCTAYASLAYYSRFIRQNLLEVLRQDYIRTAKAKGLSERTVVYRHAFRNTLIPFITLLGLSLPFVLSSSVILEVIFTWPGLGRLFFQAVLQRDFPVVMAIETATAVLVLVMTLVVDLLYGVVDPRVTHG